MRKPTQEDIAAARAEALKRFNRSDLVQVPFGAPIDVTVLGAPFDKHGYYRFYDLSMSRPADVALTTWVERALFPGDVQALAETWSALPIEFTRKLKEKAGEIREDARVEPLTALGAPAAGLYPAEAAKLLEAAQGGPALWLVTPAAALSGKRYAFVQESPDPARYEAAFNARTDATKNGYGILASTEELVCESVKWTPGGEPVEVILERLPGLMGELWYGFARAGGFGLAAEAKSV
jgi:hypothetical protein